MLKYYSPVKLEKDIIMSCDMLRLSFNLPYDMDREKNKQYIFQRWLSFNEINYSYILKSFDSSASFQYSRLYQVSFFDENKNIVSFAIGVGFNGCNKEQNSSCFIEFNPNKCYQKVLPILNYIKTLTNNLQVVRFDIAFDIPYPRELFNLIKDRRNYKKIYSMEQKNKYLDDFTEYLGKRQNNGYVKLYNKQNESNLDKPLTRLEITLDNLDYDNLIKEMPTLKAFSKSCTDLSRLNETEKVLLSLLLQNDNCMSYFGSLGRYMREKLEPYICTSFNIDITESDFYHFINLINNIIN